MGAAVLRPYTPTPGRTAVRPYYLLPGVEALAGAREGTPSPALRAYPQPVGDSPLAYTPAQESPLPGPPRKRGGGGGVRR